MLIQNMPCPPLNESNSVIDAFGKQERQLEIFFSFLTTMQINRVIDQSDDPDWKMINAVTTPTTPVSPSANAGSGAISPTF